MRTLWRVILGEGLAFRQVGGILFPKSRELKELEILGGASWRDLAVCERNEPESSPKLLPNTDHSLVSE